MSELTFSSSTFNKKTVTMAIFFTVDPGCIATISATAYSQSEDQNNYYFNTPGEGDYVTNSNHVLLQPSFRSGYIEATLNIYVKNTIGYPDFDQFVETLTARTYYDSLSPARSSVPVTQQPIGIVPQQDSKIIFLDSIGTYSPPAAHSNWVIKAEDGTTIISLQGGKQYTIHQTYHDFRVPTDYKFYDHDQELGVISGYRLLVTPIQDITPYPKQAQPYIFHNGQYQLAQPYIFHNGQWQQCTQLPQIFTVQ